MGNRQLLLSFARSRNFCCAFSYCMCFACEFVWDLEVVVVVVSCFLACIYELNWRRTKLRTNVTTNGTHTLCGVCAACVVCDLWVVCFVCRFARFPMIYFLHSIVVRLSEPSRIYLKSCCRRRRRWLAEYSVLPRRNLYFGDSLGVFQAISAD